MENACSTLALSLLAVALCCQPSHRLIFIEYSDNERDVDLRIIKRTRKAVTIIFCL